MGGIAAVLNVLRKLYTNGEDMGMPTVCFL